MSKVIANMSMSLDGFVADRSDGIQQLFGWFGNGDVEVPLPGADASFRTSAASAELLREVFGNLGALVSGRRSFDLAGGWGGRHPMGVPVFVVTHKVPEDWPEEGEHITFVTDGVAKAVERARAAAPGKWVAVASPDITRQCLDQGLLDEISVDLIPAVLGSGVPFFPNLASAPIQLDDPAVVEGTGVTHLRYRVRR
ncbi:dihydrofolate reductase family protein [Amycolatopsis aidingensis]|uniref:dihydrofolate reductase family protein n=1 Tax=Amycolatopsis aidingensis TaxID=2842453 RepID=UPI001C0BD7AD|nr:dihydrofolate reductase family protein [Amycolatopsis aidingensis]